MAGGGRGFQLINHRVDGKGEREFIGGEGGKGVYGRGRGAGEISTCANDAPSPSPSS